MKDKSLGFTVLGLVDVMTHSIRDQSIVSSRKSIYCFEPKMSYELAENCGKPRKEKIFLKTIFLAFIFNIKISGVKYKLNFYLLVKVNF